jgi:FkbM family methyltransferase
MRLSLLWKPRLACERLADRIRQHERLGRLRGTVAEGLEPCYIDSLELLEIARAAAIRSVYDIGAHTGTWTLLAKAILPDAVIQAFEPLARHQQAFARRIGPIGGITLHTVALGSQNRQDLLHVTDFSDASSLLPLAADGRHEWGVTEVDRVQVGVRRLDDYQQERRLPLPDLIKLDVQGSELDVLRGGEACLRHARAVLLEVSFAEYYEGQCLFHDVVSFLAQRNFHVKAFGESTAKGTILSQADMLFVRTAD